MGEQEEQRKDNMSAADLRSKYRDIRAKIQDKDTLFRGNNFEQLVEQTNKTRENATTMPGHMEDIECIRDMVYQLNDQVKNLSKKSGTSAADFIGALQRKFMGGRIDGEVDPSAMDWDALGMEAAEFFRSVTGLGTMLGPMDAEPRFRKMPAQRRKRERPTQTTVPDELGNDDEDGVRKETETNMETIFSIIRKRKSVPFTNLVLNRSSFAQTIENIFAFSFLVKDGRVKFTMRKDGTLLAVPMNAPTEEQRAEGGAKNAQFVMRIDFADWEEMKGMVPPGDELMPHRIGSESANAASANPRPAATTPVRLTSRNRARSTSISYDQGQGDCEEGEEIVQDKLHVQRKKRRRN